MKKLNFLQFLLLLITIIFAQNTMGQTYFTENFDGSWMGSNPTIAPSGWTQVAGVSGTSERNWDQATNTASGSWSVLAPFSTNGTYKPTTAVDGSKCAHYEDYNASALQTDTLKTGTIDLSSSTNPRIRFSYSFPYTSWSGYLQVFASNDNGINWVKLGADLGYTGSNSNWTIVRRDLPAGYNVSTVKIALVVKAAYGNADLWLDNLTIIENSPLTGIKTIKTTGGDYSSFTTAITALNDLGVGAGGVTFNVDDDLVLTEDPPAITASGTAANPIIFQRSGTGTNRPVIKPTGTSGTADAGIIINGGDYITFDGIDISIATGSAVEYGFLIKNIASTDGAQYNTIKNTKITLNKTNTISKGILQSTSSTYGGGISPTSSLGTNSNNKYYNITIENANSGIWLYGYSSYLDAGCEIGSTSATNWTTIGASTTDNIGGATTTYGVYLYYQNNYNVFNTEVRNVTAAGSYSVSGIEAYYCNGASSIYNCMVHNIKTTATSTTYKVNGIYSNNVSASLTTNIYNNIVYALNHGATTTSSTFTIYGINTLNGNATIYHNSVRIDEDAFPTSSAYYNSSATVNVKNNIFANYSTAGSTSLRYCWYNAGTVTSSSNNILYIASGTNNYVGYGNSANRSSLSLFAASISGTAPADGFENGSANANPNFTSTSDLNFAGSTPASLSGTPLSISTDITATNRNSNRPTIGAYETTQAQDDKSAPVISNISISSGVSPEISCIINDNSNSTINATVRLWYRIGNSGSFTGIDADIKPSGSINGTYTWNSSLFTLTAATYKFYITARDNQGAGSGIAVNPIYTSSFTGFNATDPPNFINNPDASANVRSFQKQNLLNGIYNVGTGEALQKLTDVANELNNSILSGDVIFELTGTYDGTTGETYPIVFNQFQTTGGNWMVTIRIKNGAGARTTSGSYAGNLLVLDGIDRIIFDGREDEAGLTKGWTISNASTASNATTISFKNDATYNIIKYCDLRGATTSTLSGVVYIYNTTGTTGNDNNTIDNCDIRNAASDHTTNLPACAVYAWGTSNSTTNDNNTISNCNIFNFWSASSSSYGIYIGSYNDAWTISGNSLYQGASRISTSGNTHNAIYITNLSGNNFSITNNNIGGSESNCGGTAWTVSGSFTNKFQAMYLNLGITTTSSVQGNKISNFNFATTSGTFSGAGSFCGINIAAGNVNVGNISGNIIGSAGIDNIKLTASNAALLVGINSASTGSVNISNNSIYGLTSVSNVINIGAYLTGIQTSGIAGNYVINNNKIGSISVANSMRAGISGTSTGASYVKGIDNSATGIISITQDTIANLANYGTNNSSTIRGVVSTAGTNSISQNIVRDIYTSSSNTGTTTSSSIIGISQTSTNSGQSVVQNTISALSNSHTTAAVVVAGIYHVSNNTDAEVISRNTIYNLEANSVTAAIYGIYSGGSTTVATHIKNNMVRLGYKKDGTDLTIGCFIAGIYDVNGTHSYYHNSIFIGGSNVVSSLNTYAFMSGTISNTRAFLNNIFVNARNNTSGSGKNYAVRVAGTGINPTGLNLNYNIYHATGTGSVFGYYGGDIANLATWKASVGQDTSSMFGDPQFIDQSGIIPNLHLSTVLPTPAEGSGIDISSINDDIDGEIRSGLTPTDIGADAGNFIPSDILPPTITYTVLSNTANLNSRVLTATVTDPSGVPLSGNGLPVLYWKINSGTYTGVQGASIGNNQYTFSFGAGVSQSDTVSYYIVAQDNAATPNVISNPFAGASGLSVNPPTCSTPPTTASSYRILKSFSGIYNVGTSQNYTSLTNTNGFFAAVNTGVITGNVTINITSNITESGSNALNQWVEEGSGNYSMIIQPNDTARILSNLYSTDGSASYVIPINGADRVTIDGGPNKLFIFRAWSGTRAYTATVIGFYNGAANDTLRNCIIESNESTTTIGAITIGTGNNNVTISNNDIRDSRAGTYNASLNTGIYSKTGANILTITNNNIYNWTRSSVGTSYGIYLLSAADGCIISGNSFYMESGISSAYTQTAINIASGNNHIINGNYIGGQSALCGGSAWINSGVYSVYGIQLATGTASTTFVAKNTIQNISLSSTSSLAFYGIYVTTGKVSIGGSGNGNIIGHNTDASKGIKIANNTSSNVMIYSASADIVGIDYNTISNINQSNTTSSAGLKGISFNTGNPTVTNNTIKLLSTASTNTGTTSSSALIGIACNSSGLNQNISNNIISDFIASTTSASAVRILGILLSGAISDGVVSKNSISNFKNSCTSSSGGYITGILMNSGYAYTIDNNVISIVNGSNTNALNIQGIWDNAGTLGTKNYYYNSIYIGGSSASGSSNSYAFNRSLNTTVDLKNNIFSNQRTGGTGKHYAIATNSNTGFTSNYNDFYTTNLTNLSSNNSGTTPLDFTGWKSITSQDINSYSVNPNFTTAINLQPLSGSYLYGTPIVNFTTDIVGINRSLTSPSIGAYEENANTKTLHLNVFLEGLYDLNSGIMRAVQDENGDHYGASIADHITVELHNSVSPYESIYSYSEQELFTNGNCSVNLSTSINDSYYIVVKHRNSLPTWSSSPVSFSPSIVNHSFTNAINKAYGDNLKELEPGVFAIYVGDVNQDEVVDLSDLVEMDTDLTNGTVAYIVYDLNGDGVVDLSDLVAIDENLTNGVVSMYP